LTTIPIPIVRLPEKVGETKITGKQQITLPAEGVRRLGWGKGDVLIVEIVEEPITGDRRILLSRKPESWTDHFAGKLGGFFGTHEENLAYLEEERRSWDEDEDEVT